MAPAVDEATVRWLLEGDAAIRYWTRTLLRQASARATARDRSAIAATGWGARLLAVREDSGRWGGGLYTPKWTSTHYTLLQLAGLGIDPRHAACRASARLLLDEGFLPDGGIAFWESRRADDCVTAMVLSILVYFEVKDERVERIVDALLAAALPSGGWNCRRATGDPRCASIHTTLSVLEALGEYVRKRRRHRVREVRLALDRGREALLSRRLYLTRATGVPIDRRVTAFTYPPRWRFDVLRCLYELARAGVAWDERMRPALELVIERRGADGRWRATAEHPGRVFFKMESPRGPGRWNTLRAAFVLQTYGT